MVNICAFNFHTGLTVQKLTNCEICYSQLTKIVKLNTSKKLIKE